MDRYPTIDTENPLLIGFVPQCGQSEIENGTFLRGLAQGILDVFVRMRMRPERAVVEDSEAYILFPFPLVGFQRAGAGIILQISAPETDQEKRWEVHFTSYPALSELALEDVLTLADMHRDVLRYLALRDDIADIDIVCLAAD